MGLTKLRTGLRAATFALTGSLFAGAAFAQDTNVVGDLEIIGRPKPHGIGFQPGEEVVEVPQVVKALAVAGALEPGPQFLGLAEQVGGL